MTGDALSGPDAPGAGTPLPPDLYQVRVEFRAKRVGYGPQSIVLTFNDPEGEAEEHLLALWQLWHSAVMERLAVEGSGPLEIS